MAVVSMQARKRATEICLVTLAVSACWLFQVLILNNFSFQNAICNLPLTLTIICGFVFGSSLPPITPDELRTKSVKDVFLHQLAGGSLSGALVGAFAAALYVSVLPVYPLSFPLVGWIAGYFSLRNFSRDTLWCIPVVLLATILAEVVMAWQLWSIDQLASMRHAGQIIGTDNLWQFLNVGQTEPFQRLAQIALPEALLNALIAPFIYFPLRGWYDFLSSNQTVD